MAHSLYRAVAVIRNLFFTLFNLIFQKCDETKQRWATRIFFIFVVFSKKDSGNSPIRFTTRDSHVIILEPLNRFHWTRHSDVSLKFEKKYQFFFFYSSNNNNGHFVLNLHFCIPLFASAAQITIQVSNRIVSNTSSKHKWSKNFAFSPIFFCNCPLAKTWF
jgi:hypothetical protein